MSDLLERKVVEVKKVKELDNGFDWVRITFQNGESVEAAAKYIFRRGEKRRA